MKAVIATLVSITVLGACTVKAADLPQPGPMEPILPAAESLCNSPGIDRGVIVIVIQHDGTVAARNCRNIKNKDGGQGPITKKDSLPPDVKKLVTSGTLGTVTQYKGSGQTEYCFERKTGARTEIVCYQY